MHIIKSLTKTKRTTNDQYIISKEQPLSFVTESFQNVILNIETANVDQTIKTIQITSTLPDEGKSTLIANLGYLLAKQNKKILMIDLDLRRPKLHRIFNVSKKLGFIDYTLRKYELKDMIRPTFQNNLDVLVSGSKTELISNILISNKLKEMINLLKETYDYILLDSPPVLSASDALYISKLSDAIIYVIAEDKAKKASIKEAVELLIQQKANILGSVLTQKESHFNHYSTKYYKNYYTSEE